MSSPVKKVKKLPKRRRVFSTKSKKKVSKTPRKAGDGEVTRSFLWDRDSGEFYERDKEGNWISITHGNLVKLIGVEATNKLKANSGGAIPFQVQEEKKAASPKVGDRVGFLWDMDRKKFFQVDMDFNLTPITAVEMKRVVEEDVIKNLQDKPGVVIYTQLLAKFEEPSAERSSKKAVSKVPGIKRMFMWNPVNKQFIEENIELGPTVLTEVKLRKLIGSAKVAQLKASPYKIFDVEVLPLKKKFAWLPNKRQFFEVDKHEYVAITISDLKKLIGEDGIGELRARPQQIVELEVIKTQEEKKSPPASPKSMKKKGFIWDRKKFFEVDAKSIEIPIKVSDLKYLIGDEGIEKLKSSVRKVIMFKVLTQ